jgi:uncharacterized protein YukE
MDKMNFDIEKAEISGRKIRGESEKLKRQASKLQKAAEASASWWIGGSRNGFERRINELIHSMNKASDLIYDMSEDLFLAAENKKEEERLLNRELVSPTVATPMK